MFKRGLVRTSTSGPLRGLRAGSGASSRVGMVVYNDRICAVKIIRRHDPLSERRNEQRSQTLRALSEVASEVREQRILHLVEVFYQSGQQRWQPPRSEYIYVILEPFLPLTLANTIGSQCAPELRMEEPALGWIFYQAVQAIIFLHTHGWAHLDLKPANIGLKLPPQDERDWASMEAYARVVLLDVDDAVYLQLSGPIPRLLAKTLRFSLQPEVSLERGMPPKRISIYDVPNDECWTSIIPSYNAYDTEDAEEPRQQSKRVRR